jgi:hypothetical protein
MPSIFFIRLMLCNEDYFNNSDVDIMKNLLMK